MIRELAVLGFLLGATQAVAEEPNYPPLRDYMMPAEQEIALARSAAPEHIAQDATIKVLDQRGYKIVAEGSNGFVCLVMRGWAAPSFSPVRNRLLVYDAKLRAPICFNPIAARTVLPYQEFRAKLGVARKTPDEISAAVQAAYAKGDLPKMEAVAFAYMFSANQRLGPAGAWHPHMMVYTPNYDNAMLGGNGDDTMLPRLTDDAGTPFAVTVIPVDHDLAVHIR